MSETYLDLVERLAAKRAYLWKMQMLEKKALDMIETVIPLQAEAKDHIESLEAVLKQLRHSENPKSWFVRAFNR